MPEFGLTKVVLRPGPSQPRSTLDRGGELSTIYGPLRRGEVMAQMLVVPLAIWAALYRFVRR